jgi:hypothetical protein
MRLPVKQDVNQSFQINIKIADLDHHPVAGTMTASWCQKRRSPESELP